MLAQVIGWMVIAAFLVGVSYGCGSITCESKAEKMGLRHSYGLVEGCMVKVDNRWVPIEAFRVVD